MNTIIPWLEHLKVLIPPGRIVLVGAGNGKGIWAQWLVHHAKKSRVTLIEAESLQYSMLQRTLSLLGECAQHCATRNALVGIQQGMVPFFVASSQQESGLLDPQVLRNIWPNLDTQEVKKLDAITMDALLGNSREVDDLGERINKGYWLLIDCLPAVNLLRSTNRLEQVNVIIARILLDESGIVPNGTGLKEAASFLESKGFSLIVIGATRHPAIVHALFVRDTHATLRDKEQMHLVALHKLQLQGEEQMRLAQERQTRIEELVKAETVLEKQVQEQAKRLEQLRRVCDEQTKLAQERQLQIEQYIKFRSVADKQILERDLQLQQLSTERDRQERLLQEYQAQVEQLMKGKEAAEIQVQDLLQKEKNIQEQLRTEIEQKLDVQSLFKKQAEELVRQRKFLDNSLKKAITSSSRQIQAFTGLENYWLTGELPTANNETHAWPVSPDFSLYLVTLLDKNDYDIVIEFGTGVSTVVVAKALKKLATKRQGKEPVNFISFDHLDQYYQQTLSMLQQSGLVGYVQLHYAPLEDWEAPNGYCYPYYSCQKILENHALQHLSADLRILVIVDGPPGSISPHARYPAVPLVLRYYPDAHIDFLLDDYARLAEKEIVKFWEEDMKSENLQYNSRYLKMEKDACLISVHNKKTAG